MTLNRYAPIFQVDFNKMLHDNYVVFFSRHGIKENIYGANIVISLGMKVIVYMDDINNFNNKDRLLSNGYVIENPINEHPVKWCCKMQTEIKYELEDGVNIYNILESFNK